MEFKDYVNSLPNEREQTIMDLAKICRVSNSTVYRWLRGDFMPDPLKRKVIADYLRKSEKRTLPQCVMSVGTVSSTVIVLMGCIA